MFVFVLILSVSLVSVGVKANEPSEANWEKLVPFQTSSPLLHTAGYLPSPSEWKSLWDTCPWMFTEKFQRQVRRKKAMYSIYGLATRGPQHKKESELLFPPSKDTFMSVRGKKKFDRAYKAVYRE